MCLSEVTRDSRLVPRKGVRTGWKVFGQNMVQLEGKLTPKLVTLNIMNFPPRRRKSLETNTWIEDERDGEIIIAGSMFGDFFRRLFKVKFPSYRKGFHVFLDQESAKQLCEETNKWHYPIVLPVEYDDVVAEGVQTFMSVDQLVEYHHWTAPVHVARKLRIIKEDQ